MYKCEKCGRIFDNKESCTRCEDSHVELQDIELVSVECEYGSIMPTRIYIKSKKTKRRYSYILE